MKTKLSVFTIALILAATMLSACGNKPEGNAVAPETRETAKVPERTLKEGTAILLSTAKQMRKAANAGDEAKIKELGPQLEKAWSAYEDEVKPKYPDVYEQVEKALDPTIAAANKNPVNKDALLTINNQLIQVLYDFSAKLIPVDQIKAGASQMLATTSELRKEIAAGNEAKVKELGPKLEEVWKTFEDGVQPRSADLYNQIEKSLNPEVAGSQKTPMDQNILAQLNDGLTQALNELVQTLK
jgi:iron uptake system EfeUOB component EfeO/EfeM